MYLYGASGHAMVIIDILKSRGIEIEGLIDDDENKNNLLGYNILHNIRNISPVIVSIGNNIVRKRIVESLFGSFGTAIHSSAILSDQASIGLGTVIMQGAIIQSGAKIGNHCIINTGSKVDHECVISDFVHISPNATLCGNVQIDEGAFIGAGSVIIPGIHIGKWSVIGAGSVVVNDLPDKVVAYGNPCRIIKKLP
jgi:sugar O-acyltransferase (sialic acid O-acetyltransferase NeuD family)